MRIYTMKRPDYVFFEYTKRIIFLGDKNMKRFFMRYGVVMIMICCLVFVILALSPARYPIANFSSRVYNTVNVAFQNFKRDKFNMGTFKTELRKDDNVANLTVYTDNPDDEFEYRIYANYLGTEYYWKTEVNSAGIITILPVEDNSWFKGGLDMPGQSKEVVIDLSGMRRNSDFIIELRCVETGEEFATEKYTFE